MNRIYSGVGSFVDEPQKSCDSLAWTFPILKTGSNFAHMKLDTRVTLYKGTAKDVRYGQPLLPTDYIRYSCFSRDCVCRGAHTQTRRWRTLPMS